MTLWLGLHTISDIMVANLDLPTRLPSQGQPSLPDTTFLSGHLLPDVVHPHHRRFVPTRASARLTARDLQQRQSQRGGDLLNPHCQPPALPGKKSSGTFFSDILRHHIPLVMSVTLCDPYRWETSVALTTLSNLPSSCWTGTSSRTFTRKHMRHDHWRILPGFFPPSY